MACEFPKYIQYLYYCFAERIKLPNAINVSSSPRWVSVDDGHESRIYMTINVEKQGSPIRNEATGRRGLYAISANDTAKNLHGRSKYVHVCGLCQRAHERTKCARKD